ncbi:MAG: hypothetical protein HY543_11735 [Deltaproteobacteria bacterium]|nr:hypothetical protein [Deltaproteobacteria bacterium]
MLLALPLMAACGSSSSTDDSSSGGTTSGGGTGTITSSDLTTIYPRGLAVTSPTASSSSTSSDISVGKGVDDDINLATATPPTVSAQTSTINGMLDAKTVDGCKFSVDMTKQPPTANCYGPTLTYTNHPDRLAGESGNGQLPPGDLGIWVAADPSTSEACVAAKMNALVGDIITEVKMSQEIGAAVLCRAKFANKTLPEKGKSVDLTEEAKAVMTASGIPAAMSSAILDRAAENSGDSPIYTATMTGTFGTTSDAFTVIMRMVPASESDNSTYKGRLSMKFERSSAGFQSFETLGNCTGSNGVTEAFSVDFQKSSATSVTYSLRRAQFCGTGAAPFNTKNQVDLSLKKTSALPKGWGNDGNFALFTFNPSDNTGNYIFAWQAGANDAHTRVLKVKIESAGDAGCGYFGYGPDIAASTVGALDGIICNWAGPGQTGTKQVTARAQRQCFDKSSGKYISRSSNLATTYAPTHACDKTVAQNFSYQTTDNSVAVTTAQAVTNNLVMLADVDVSTPTEPSVP